jgi:hypothetical protein
VRARGGERPGGRRVRPDLEPGPSSRSGTTPTGGGHPPARERGKGEGGAADWAGGVWAVRRRKKRKGGGQRPRG